MKWTNKGNEHYIYEECINDLKNGADIYLYGAGRIGKQVGKILDRYNLLSGFIDNNSNNEKLLGQKIVSSDNFFKNTRKYIIFITVTKTDFVKEIENDLNSKGLKKHKDYFLYDEFMERVLPEIILSLRDKTFGNFIQMCLTERCTLKCKNCAHACYAVDINKKDSKDLTLEQAKNSVDWLFNKFDYVSKVVLLGGEPLLYNKLSDVIDYIGSNYIDRLGEIIITTNGTIIPKEEILNACKKYNVYFDISNYSYTIKNLKNNYIKLCHVLEENNIRYLLGDSEREWYDYGFQYVNHQNNEEKLIQVFDGCGTICHEIRENRLYYCVMARSVSENLNFGVGREDYLDLQQLNGENWKKILVEFISGYSEKGYLDMCNFCNGGDCIKYKIPVAEQLN